MKIILAINLCVILLSCSAKFSSSEFFSKPVKRRLNEHKSIFCNGAYYNFNELKKELKVIFVYENGIKRSTTFDSNHCSKNTIRNCIENLVEHFPNKKNDIFYFNEGGYNIVDGKIIIQDIQYIPQFSWGIVTHTGYILNDSTFYLNRINFPKRGIIEKDSSVYNFLRISKPDSLLSNKWAKKKWYWLKDN